MKAQYCAQAKILSAEALKVGKAADQESNKTGEGQGMLEVSAQEEEEKTPGKQRKQRRISGWNIFNSEERSRMKTDEVRGISYG